MTVGPIVECPVCGHSGPVIDHGPYDYIPERDDVLVMEGNVHIVDDRAVDHYVECPACRKGFDVAYPALA